MKFLYYLSIVCVFTSSLYGQGPADKYTGMLSVPGVELEMTIRLLENDDAWSGTLDIPLQRVKGMPLEDLVISGKDFSFKLPEVPGNASYSGRFSEDYSSISGKFSQGGQKLDLTFTSESAEDKIKDQAIVERLKILADSLLVAHHVPGMGFGIVKDGEVILSEGFGYRDYENKIEADDETIFAIGSCSKAFTAAGVALLADQDLIEWDEPVTTYLPDFELHDKFASEESTPLDLLVHRSGLPRHDLLWYGSPLSRHELYTKLKYLEPTTSFRTTFQYQNLMYMTAGLLIEKMSNQTWEEYTQEMIFNPLGMDDSNFSVDVSQEQGNYALPYRVDDDEVIKMDFRNIDNVAPAGSINSNVKDMLKWAKLNLDRGQWMGQQLIVQDQFDVLHEPQMIVSTPFPVMNHPEFSKPGYGGGWFIYNYAGTKVVQHGGNIDGFSGYVYLLPDEDIAMVFMVNKNGAILPGVLANYATDLFLENEPTDWASRFWPNEEEEESDTEEVEESDEGKVVGTNPSSPRSEYTGIYEHPGYGQVEIKDERGGLQALYNAFDMPLTHYHYDVYEAQILPDEDDMMKIQFSMDIDGAIQNLAVSLEPSLDPIIFTKVSEPQHKDADYRRSVAGTYHLAGLDVHIKDENGRLYMAPVGQPTWELESSKKDVFLPKGLPGFRVKFKFKDGKAYELIAFQPNGTFAAKRVED